MTNAERTYDCRKSKQPTLCLKRQLQAMVAEARGQERASLRNALLEVALAVSEALEAAGIPAPLSGGAAMSLYTDNKYLTRDLDFVTSARGKDLKAVLEPFGTLLRESDIPITDYPKGSLRIITPTQSLMDRLAAYFHWNRQPELRTQVRQFVATMDPRGGIDWPALYEWARQEGMISKVNMAYSPAVRSVADRIQRARLAPQPRAANSH